MTQTYFPAGTQIGDFVIRTFLKQNRLGSTYVAADSSGKKHRLTVLNAQPEKLMEHDISVWTRSPETGILTDISFMREPVPCIISPCVSGLTLEECSWAEFSISLQEAVSLLYQIEEIRNDLTRRGAEDSFISMESILLNSEKHLVLQRDNLFFSHFSSIRKRLADAMFELAEPIPGISTEKIKKHYLTFPDKEINICDLQFKDETYVSPGVRKFRRNLIIIAAAVVGILLISCAVLWLRQKVKPAKPAVEEYQITANFHSKGPIIHAGKENVEDSGKTPVISVSPDNPGTRSSASRKPAAPVRKKSVPVKGKKSSKPIQTPPPQQPIIAAVRAGDIQLVKYLISKNANVNCRDSQGNTPMFYAVGTNWEDMIRTLYQAGANITQKELDASRNNPSTQKFLLQLIRQSKEGKKSSAPRQSQSKPEPQEWLNAPNRWYIRLDQAQAQANIRKKKIIIFFVGPDRHQPSAVFEAQVLRSPSLFALSRYAEIVYIKLSNSKNMPRQQKIYNEKLSRKYTNNKLPYTVILNSKGRRLYSTSTFRDAKKFLNKLRQELQ